MGIRRAPAVWGISAILALAVSGCGFGPKALYKTRLPYNEAVKTTSEEQLLLNIVRLRYSDNPSSLAVTTIAAQFELAKKLQLVPFFTSAAAGDVGSYKGAVLPGAEFNAADRPTLSLTPQDEAEFARRLFNPLSLDGIVYLAKTTWPISTVFRLYLENLNWVSNAQTASGPTPTRPPEFEEFLRGILALQRLQDANKVAILLEERDERVGGTIRPEAVTGRDLVEAAKANHEFKREDELEPGEARDDGEGKGGDRDRERREEDRKDGKPGKDRKKDAGEASGRDGWIAAQEKLPDPKREKDGGKAKPAPGWALVKKKETPFLYVAPDAAQSPDWLEFCQVFKIRPGLKKYEVEVTKLTPFPSEYPAEGVKVIDLETRSLLQVLYFVSHGVEVPPEHLGAGLARATLEPGGAVFDYQRVLGGLFKVKTAACKKRPEGAAVAVHYLDRWYYIEDSDHDTRATFALLLHLSRLELGTKAGGSPVLTLPLGGR